MDIVDYIHGYCGLYKWILWIIYMDTVDYIYMDNVDYIYMDIVNLGIISHTASCQDGTGEIIIADLGINI